MAQNSLIWGSKRYADLAPSGGERTAALVPAAELLLVPDMGHDRPVPLWPEICGAIIEHTS